MLYSKELLIELVKINMEEGFSGSDVERAGGVGVESYIESKLPEAVNAVFMAAPDILLPQTDISKTLIPKKNQNGSGEIILPRDVLRITLLRMKGWDRVVTKFENSNSIVATMQNNPYTMAGKAKPVVVLALNRSGDKVLRYYSLPPEVRNHEIAEALYVKIPDMSAPIEIH
ncbi:MAG: hypothetical protein IJA28_01490, partial [Coprobacter sp.]|nr:hypothetical protein [Coprobacter sp.]